MKTKKKYLIIFCFTVLFLFFLKIDFRFENSVNCCGDDHDYYIHSETIALDRDLDYTNQLKGNEDKRFNVNGKIAPTGFIGTGILAAPFTFKLGFGLPGFTTVPLPTFLSGISLSTSEVSIF